MRWFSDVDSCCVIPFLPVFHVSSLGESFAAAPLQTQYGSFENRPFYSLDLCSSVVSLQPIRTKAAFWGGLPSFIYVHLVILLIHPTSDSQNPFCI